MKLAIMQPYFFPYIGYFQLMQAVDQWVIFDDIQFIDKGWINRNRILHANPEKEWQFMTIPLDKRGQFDKICQVSIKQSENWKERILGKLAIYKKKAPHYKKTIDFVNECFDTEEENLSKFLSRTIRMTAEALDINTKIEIQTELDTPQKKAQHPGQWALNISKELGAHEYINPHSGAEIFRPDEFDKEGISLSFIKPNLKTYKQLHRDFVPGLSIIDLMMWNDIVEIKQSLKEDFSIITSSSR